MNTAEELVQLALRAVRMRYPHKRVALYLDGSMATDEGEYLPAIVVAGERGLLRLPGDVASTAANWFGRDCRHAVQRVDQINHANGVSVDEALAMTLVAVYGDRFGEMEVITAALTGSRIPA